MIFLAEVWAMGIVAPSSNIWIFKMAKKEFNVAKFSSKTKFYMSVDYDHLIFLLT